MLCPEQVAQRLEASEVIMKRWKDARHRDFEVHCASQCVIPYQGFDSKLWFQQGAKAQAKELVQTNPNLFTVDDLGSIDFTTTLWGGGFGKATKIALFAKLCPRTHTIADFVVLLDPTVEFF